MCTSGKSWERNGAESLPSGNLLSRLFFLRLAFFFFPRFRLINFLSAGYTEIKREGELRNGKPTDLILSNAESHLREKTRK